ncbi:MAG TPA: UDP-2,3-diacylglucosamine diphosphatase LpxI, partial [Pararhizobium sp.]|nr:UDP-2,3-diacylglucosamine diphosphatase LpxI [Pararhizobium sp.]
MPADGSGRLAIIAGHGRLPHDVAEAARRAGEDPFIVGLKAETDRDWGGFDHILIGTGDFAALEKAFRAHGIGRVVLSGGVQRRPDWRDIRPTRRVLAKVPSILRMLMRAGDDAVLRMVIALIEAEGHKVIGAHEVVPDLLAECGALTVCRPKPEDWRNISAGRAAALALGVLDVGQGAVAVGGRVVALEGAEGTDAMLERVAQLRRDGRITRRTGGVLVKFCKPQQEERADLPSIGLSTVANAAAAGLAGIAVEAGR